MGFNSVFKGLNTQWTIGRRCTERYKKNISDIKCTRDKQKCTKHRQPQQRTYGCIQTRWWWKQSDNEVIYLLTYLLVYLLTYYMQQSPTWVRNRFSASQEIPRIYGTRRFITAFTSARHLSLSWARSIQSIPPNPTSWKSILILSSHLSLGLPSCLFPSCFPTKTPYTPLLSPYVLHALPSHCSWFNNPKNIGWGVQIIKFLIM